METRLPQAELVARLAELVGDAHVATGEPERIAYGTDFWPKTQIWKQGGEHDRYPPDCVVWPGSEEELAGVVRLCVDQSVPIVPYGAGSGVCGGTVPLHGGVVVDVKRLRQVRDLDDEALTVTVDAGMIGQHLEDHLAHHGLTLGHFPASILCSTVGGWLAARSAGQFSSRYGKIEDMVVSVRAVLPDGRIVDTAERGRGDPDWTQLLVGSEGTLGFITQATLRVHRAAPMRRMRGYRFYHLQDALKGMRLVMQSGLQPIVLRLYDPFDSFIALGRQQNGWPLRLLRGVGQRLQPAPDEGEEPMEVGTPQPRHRWARSFGRRLLGSALGAPGTLNGLTDLLPSTCLLIVGFEGPEELVERQSWRAQRILAESGGRDAGAGPGDRWLAHRYDVSFKQIGMYRMGAFVDTMEVAATWDRVDALYDEVCRAVAPLALVMAHFSHAYREGCSIYFTFAAWRRRSADAEAHYERIWSRALHAVHARGGTASHHHGVGALKKHVMGEEHGEMLRVWRALKDALDPAGVMNPGKLVPEGAEAE